jgi:hypothetical protein
MAAKISKERFGDLDARPEFPERSSVILRALFLSFIGMPLSCYDFFS